MHFTLLIKWSLKHVLSDYLLFDFASLLTFAFIHGKPWETLQNVTVQLEKQRWWTSKCCLSCGIGKPIVLGGLQGKQKSTPRIIDNQKALHSSNGQICVLYPHTYGLWAWFRTSQRVKGHRNSARLPAWLRSPVAEKMMWHSGCEVYMEPI